MTSIIIFLIELYFSFFYNAQEVLNSKRALSKTLIKAVTVSVVNEDLCKNVSYLYCSVLFMGTIKLNNPVCFIYSQVYINCILQLSCHKCN